jgi:hypothetical protein
VPPFDSATALAIIQSNLGAPADMVFAEFDPTPIAAASLGQVHLARLDNGEQVVVKVQRPGLKDLFDIDLKNIRWARRGRGTGHAGEWARGRARGAGGGRRAREPPAPVWPCALAAWDGQAGGRAPERRRKARGETGSRGGKQRARPPLTPARPASAPRSALAVWLQKADPKTDGAARDWVAIYDECSRILYEVGGRGAARGPPRTGALVTFVGGPF